MWSRFGSRRAQAIETRFRSLTDILDLVSRTTDGVFLMQSLAGQAQTVINRVSLGCNLVLPAFRGGPAGGDSCRGTVWGKIAGRRGHESAIFQTACFVVSKLFSALNLLDRVERMTGDAEWPAMAGFCSCLRAGIRQLLIP